MEAKASLGRKGLSAMAVTRGRSLWGKLQTFLRSPWNICRLVQIKSSWFHKMGRYRRPTIKSRLWRRKWQPTPVQRSLADCSSWDYMTENACEGGRRWVGSNKLVEFKKKKKKPPKSRLKAP